MRWEDRALAALNWVSALTMAVAIYMVFLAAPTERTMGMSQRIFYFHVGSGWVGACAFLVALAAGLLLLWTGKREWDRLAVAAVETGLAFTTMIIATGSIWAKAAWNTWWTWSPRLTSAAVMWLVYAAYLLLRSTVEDPGRRARYGAVYATVGFVSVVATFVSIRLLRDIHPTLFGTGAGEMGGGLAYGMRLPFCLSLVAFSLLGVTLTGHRLRLARIGDDIAQLHLRLLEYLE